MIQTICLNCGAAITYAIGSDLRQYCDEHCHDNHRLTLTNDTTRFLFKPRSELKQRFFDLLHKNQLQCLEMLHKKNSDYTDQDPDPFINFRNPKMKGLLDQLSCSHPDDVESAIFEQVAIKFNRIANLLFSPNPPANEKLDDSFDDLMNYTNLLKTYRQMHPRT